MSRLKSLAIAFLVTVVLITGVSVTESGHGGAGVAGAITPPGATTGFVLPYSGTLRYEHLAPTEVADPAQLSRPIGMARADEIAAAMGFSKSDILTNEQYIQFVTGRGVDGDLSLAVLLGQSVNLFINNHGSPLYSTVDGRIRTSVLSSFGLMVDPAGMLQSLANESSPSKIVNVDLAPGGYMGTWCRANGCGPSITALYESAYTGEVIFGNASQQNSEPAQLVVNEKNGVSTQVGMSMIPSIWLVNFILLYALNPNYAALMPSYWAPIPSGVSSALWDNGGKVPYSQFASQLPSYEELLSIIAGNGTQGSSEPSTGPSTAAALNKLGSTAVDAAGNTYIADTDNNVVEKVTPAGTLSVIAGGGIAAGGISSPAGAGLRLDGPRGVAVDADGNVYIADTGNDRIMKVAPGGAMTLVAGGGATSPLVPGLATDAMLDGPRGVAVDADGNVYIADSGNDLIEKVALDGMLSVVAGGGATSPLDSGPATQMQLSDPGGVAVDGQGNVYIADTGNNLVEEVDAASGNLYVLAGGGTMSPQAAQASTTWNDHFGLGLQIQLNGPQGIAVDSSGVIYIADTGNNVIEKVTCGIFSVIAGGGATAPSTNGPATSARLNAPRGVAVSPSGVVHIADTGNNVVERIAGVTRPATYVAPVVPSFTG